MRNAAGIIKSHSPNKRVSLLSLRKITTMFSKKVEAALNKQIILEGFSSNIYLSMAVWAA